MVTALLFAQILYGLFDPSILSCLLDVLRGRVGLVPPKSWLARHACDARDKS